MTDGRPPRDVLVVGWYPRVDDQIAGRFIADQVAALRATGRVRPTVVSFDPLALHGDLPLRTHAAAAWTAIVEQAARRGFGTLPAGAFGPDGVPVARLGTVVGRTEVVGRINEHDHRAASLAAWVAGHGSPPWSLVHAHVGYPDGGAAARVARAHRLPLVLTEHATYLDRLFADPDTRAAYREAVVAADRIVAVGSDLAERIAAEFPELADRIVVIPNAVDVDAFQPVAPDERDPDELLWVGYRREVKGMPNLLQAFRLVRSTRPTATLRLIGRSTTDDEEAGWLRLAAELDVADAVHFGPPANRAGIAAAMARAALFVHPSRRETMGIVAVEALAAGLPVVATDSGGVTEVLGPDPTAVGALVPVDEPEALAAAILATLERRVAFDPHALRAHVVGRYGGAAIATRIANLYDEVLAEHGVGDPGPHAAGGIAVPPRDGPVVLVSFDRALLDRFLATAPPWASEHLTIVTLGDPLPDHPTAVVLAGAEAAGVAELMRSSTRARSGGPLGLLAAGPRWLLRRWRRRRLASRARPALTAAVDRGLAAAAASAGGQSAIVVCAAGIDVLAVEPLRDGGTAIAPGGLRWLGDLAWVRRTAAAARPAPPQPTGEAGADAVASSPASAS